MNREALPVKAGSSHRFPELRKKYPEIMKEYKKFLK